MSTDAATGRVRRPIGGRQDWEVDGADIVPLLGERTHLAAHSYGCHGALHAAVAAPARVASLTLIEPPLYFLNPGDPEIERFASIGDEVLAEGEHADPAHLREFLGVAGVPVDEGPLPDAVLAGVRRAHGGRLPSESRPDLGAIRSAGIPVLVASGEHMPGIERICDALALGARRGAAAGARRGPLRPGCARVRAGLRALPRPGGRPRPLDRLDGQLSPRSARARGRPRRNGRRDPRSRPCRRRTGRSRAPRRG